MTYTLIGSCSNVEDFSKFIEESEFDVHGITSFDLNFNAGDWPEINVFAVENNVVETLAKRFGLKLK